jgi:hypothetical protein
MTGKFNRENLEKAIVLRKNLSLPNEDHNKWAPNYEGSYMVKNMF